MYVNKNNTCRDNTNKNTSNKLYKIFNADILHFKR